MPEPQLPTIPEYITVHLGRPDQDATNVEVPFVDYIKSVASSEIYPTWPDSAIRANILAQISFALSRIYSEWYTSRGYDFQITNSTQYDQAYVHQREVFDNISRIVDEVFNNYIVRRGSVSPLFTPFCDGRTVYCNGLSQWGSVALAQQGYTPYEILTHYYGDDIDIISNAPVQTVAVSYDGTPLRRGASGNDVRTIQLQLNRIRRNYPAIPPITQLDGVYGVETEAAVRTFQEVFNPTPDGVVGKATWYKIKQLYSAVKQLGELTSEGIDLEEATPIFITDRLMPGDYGIEVQSIQYYISVIGYFNDAVPVVDVDGVYGSETEYAVRQFQSLYGLPVTGEVDRATWLAMVEAYDGIVSSLTMDIYGQRSPIYPGYVLNRGLENDDVRLVQTWLNTVRSVYTSIPPVNITGFFGEQTEAAVREFQRIFGLPPTGTVGPVTWQRLRYEYDDYRGLV